jgi:uncharacterized membrane protein
LVSALAGIGVAVSLYSHGVAVRAVAGWDAGAFTFLCLVWFLILGSDQQETKCRAAGVDPGRTVVGALITMASAFSIFAGSYVMRHAASIEPNHKDALVALALVAVVLAWGLTHTSYTLRYAHLYYRDDDEGEGGLTFPGDNEPDDYDFAYFSFTIGMTFQVSDVVITSRQIRRAVLGHGLISFAYNTVILALALNLLFGFLS